jgi:hypothetical protein
VLKVRK